MVVLNAYYGWHHEFSLLNRVKKAFSLFYMTDMWRSIVSSYMLDTVKHHKLRNGMRCPALTNSVWCLILGPSRIIFTRSRANKDCGTMFWDSFSEWSIEQKFWIEHLPSHYLCCACQTHCFTLTVLTIQAFVIAMPTSLWNESITFLPFTWATQVSV